MKAITDLRTKHFKGGAKPFLDVVHLKSGEYSSVQNMRPTHPGLEARKGQRALHSTADGTNAVMSLFQFVKGRRTERHFLAQMSDGDLLDATANPPTVTVGAFGSEVFDGASGQVPASYATLNDMLVYANGADYHQIYSGQQYPIGGFHFVQMAGAIPLVVEVGKDFTAQVTDGLTTTFAEIDSMGDLATDYDAIFIMTDTPADTFNITIGNANGTESALQVHFYDGAAWTAASSVSDGTSASSKAFAQSGAITFTMPTTIVDHYMFGKTGYWYRISLSSGDLDSDTTITEVTYETDFRPIRNVWDGITPYIIEAQLYDTSASTYSTFGGSSVDISSAALDDILYVSSADPLWGLYIDVGDTPNSTASTTISHVYYWSGTAWVEVTDRADGTSGFHQSGFLTWDRLGAGVEQPLMFEGTHYFAYWYKITWDTAISDTPNIGIQGLPWFDVTELGKSMTCCSWKDRMVYSFTLYPQYLYVSAQHQPQVLNGDDFGILVAGDGRAHKIVAMRKFHNELMVWQEELGSIGGTLTLFEGYSPSTFGKLVLSSTLGLLNNNAVAIVDGVFTSTKTDETIKTLAFCLSRLGVYISDGRTCSMISDDIQDYFDPTKSVCIRRGYESKCWLSYDSTYNGIRVGLVSGSSATVCNVFLFYDLVDKEWSVDSLAQALGCATEVEAASGDVQVLQVGGGTGDGTVYQLNYGNDDISTAVDAHVQVELDAKGYQFNLDEMIVRCTSQTAGSFTLTPYKNGVAGTAKTLEQTAALTSEVYRRHRFRLNVTGTHIGFRLRHNTAGEPFKLLDWGAALNVYEDQ
jgi:hypothetical protein